MGVWIDTDMGFDDIAAIMVVDAEARSRPELAIDGVSLVVGNAPLDQVKRNAAGAVEAFSWQFPIYSGRALPVLGKLETATSILSDHGMPTAGLRLPEVRVPAMGDAFEALCRWLEGGGPKRILALGPLTNIAAIALARPDLAARITDLVWMGGAVTAGNHTASAEFNAFADPEAIAIVLSHGIPFRMVDLDLCRQVLAAPSDVEPVRSAGGRNAALVADLLDGFIAIATSRGRPAMALYDAVAAVAFIDEGLVEWRPARIDVELAGTVTRGRTVVETRSGKAEFNAAYAATIAVDPARLIILETLHGEGSR
ncbi:nucleoside hydrolase [Rhizobiales bacterium RZME27]|jgi:purine nucleosidase|uniref:Nucleoside hydrolase n=1 Tax=Endobacterium cereale TaxID=2663029 RepID=A0A6A8ACR8_9HYPH|nr:nucleoside hydrolase [Endobacterium cereale]MEB2847265.1 nucleoside hydrolase [Endobacterium cereale]MQY49115.1 nucleoside hydrolase [Endobacterium cereale]